MMRKFACGILLTLLVGACSTLGTSTASPEVRVANRSSFDFTSVRVAFPSDEVNYGAVAAGAASEYRRVEEAYRYAYIEVMIGERRLVMQPIDYVGDTLLSPGRYTYALGMAQGGDQLTLQLERD
jgi:hypothetical protein